MVPDIVIQSVMLLWFCMK